MPSAPDLSLVFAQLGEDERRVVLGVAWRRLQWEPTPATFYDLYRAWDHATPSDQRFIMAAATRLLDGQRTYGLLDPATDTRDFVEEKFFDDVDGANYEEMDRIQKASRP